MTSVLTDTKVNTFRAGGTLEDTVHSNPAWRALKPEYATCVPCPDDAGADQLLVQPTLTYDSFTTQSATTMDYSLQRSWQFSDTFSWFIPEAKGTPRPEVRRAIHAHVAQQSELGKSERHVQLRPRPRVRRQQSPHLPEPAEHSSARIADLRNVDARLRVLRPGQVAAEAWPDPQLWCSLRSRADAVRHRSGKSVLRRQESVSNRQGQHLTAHRPGVEPGRRRQIRIPRRLWALLRSDAVGNDRQLLHGPQIRAVVHGEFPADQPRSRAGKRAISRPIRHC